MTLLDEIEGFLSRTGTSPTKFGLDSMNDPGFVPGLREGRDVKMSTADKVRAFMRDFDAQADAA